MAQASVALNDARALLNDQAAQFWTDAILMPYLQRAHRELQLKLNSRQSSTIKEVAAVITVSAQETPFNLTLPADFIEPIKLKERQSGSSASFVDMAEQTWETGYTVQESLCFWVWREEAVKLPGSLQDREVELYYKKGLPVPTQQDSELGINRAETFLGSRTAALAVRYIMQDVVRADQLDGETIDSLKDYLKTEVRSLQDRPARRQRYLSRRRYGS